MPTGADAVAYALAQTGKPYVWGAEGPSSYDCSGLLWDAYKQIGITIPRTTHDMIGPRSNLVPISRAQVQAGDLIFSNWGGGRSSHVGIADGQGNLIEAPEPGKTVTVTKLTDGYWAHTDNYRRAPGVDGNPVDPTGTVVGAIQGAIGNITGMIPNPGNVTEALANIGSAAGSFATSAQSVANLAGIVTRAMLPSNLLRGSALIMGAVFILIGIWFLGREIKESS